MAKFNNSKAQIDQQQPSGFTKEILRPHVRFQVDNDTDDKNEVFLSHKSMPDPDDDWIAQYSDQKVMGELVGEWGIRCTKVADRRAACASPWDR